MNAQAENTPQESPSPSPQLHLEEVERFLAKLKLVEGLVHRQSEHDGRKPQLVEDLVHKQHVAELRKRIDRLHPADVAYVLEGLPLEDRLFVWGLVGPDREGEVLLETSDAVRETLLADMNTAEIVAAARELDADEVADLAPDLSDEVVQDIMEERGVEDRAQLQAALSYSEGTIGALMDFDVATIRDDALVEDALQILRRYDELPQQTDSIFVVDRFGRLKGVLPLAKLLVSNPDVSIEQLYDPETVAFSPERDADEVAQAFERYNLVSAPVLDGARHVVGRITVDAVLEYVREHRAQQDLAKVGLREEEDIFASVWQSAKNRGPWLALNLCTAFVASRVVGAFEGSIEKLAALAALMPIVAGIGGNSGNQTSTLIVRALALGQIGTQSARRLLVKELGISALNGAIWGTVLGVAAWALYRNVALGGVMALAMLLNLLVAAIAGFAIPLAMERFGRDPAVGSSVFLTFITDSMGFFIFLGLATVFLM
ncbi:MAG: magnesium transporter [Burkholderiales bacterium]|nr:magnesium transporter [Burkholderiales bacterium]